MATPAMGGRLEAGIAIYEFQPTMFHCKVMVIDDLWVSVGSTNFDSRSFRLNAEANLNVVDRGLASQERAAFERDRRRAAAAEKQALEYGQPGEPVGWRGGAGRHGTIVPGVDYEIRGIRCRDYTHSIYIDRRPQTARTTACRNPDATWSPIG